MTIPKDILKFIDAQFDLCIGYNEIVFFKPQNIAELQIGYSYDNTGKSLTDHTKGSWNDKWVVIATDQLGDPIFVDSSSSQLTVYSAAHGEGAWEPYIISDSLFEFKEIVGLLQKMSIDRTNPVEIEENPINDNDKADFLRYVTLKNLDTELWYWEQFFE
jgi:hypothetical protein